MCIHANAHGERITIDNSVDEAIKGFLSSAEVRVGGEGGRLRGNSYILCYHRINTSKLYFGGIGNSQVAQNSKASKG